MVDLPTLHLEHEWKLSRVVFRGGNLPKSFGILQFFPSRQAADAQVRIVDQIPRRAVRLQGMERDADRHEVKDKLEALLFPGHLLPGLLQGECSLLNALLQVLMSGVELG